MSDCQSCVPELTVGLIALMNAQYRQAQAARTVCRCGPVDFVVPQTEDNKPRNILEEIVWCACCLHKSAQLMLPLVVALMHQ